MKFRYVLALSLGTITSCVFAGGSVFSNEGSSEVRFIEDNKRMPDERYQEELRNSAVWQDFLEENGTWYVIFNEENRKPQRAFGMPIPTYGNDLETRARNFVEGALAGFSIPVQELVLTGITTTAKHHMVNFHQVHGGIKVFNSRMMVKMSLNHEVISFGADVFNDINTKAVATLSAIDATSKATTGITETIISSTPQDDLMFLPIPGNKANDYHLVYVVDVKTQMGHIPGDYFTLVDAENGNVLYRVNRVMYSHDHLHTAKPEPKPKAVAPPPPGAIDVKTYASVYKINSYLGLSSESLPNLRVRINGTDYYTDDTGNLASPEVGPQSGTVYLEGLYSEVSLNGAPVASFAAPGLINASLNTLDFSSHATAQEITAYYHVNVIHDFMKNLFPTFTDLDNPLPTNVDLTTDDCNAFYNGSSINFYAAGGGCLSMATVGDVTYHEYGHGINDKYYDKYSQWFQNGAMNEGYADVWAFAKFRDPILGDGYDAVDPLKNIRRYDQDPKVYPSDIVGEVHADGEIIAGAWWDTYVNLGNDSAAMVQTMDLFALAFPGFSAAVANSQEGQAFTNTLIDVLEADDNDANITNGTPNGVAITQAFAKHGITLLSNAQLVHTAIDAATPNVDIVLEADLTLSFPWSNYLGDVIAYYRINNSTTWNSEIMTNVGGSNYEATITAQPEGTVIPYYVGLVDIFNNLSGVKPVGAAEPDPNIPYYILVGFVPTLTDDSDNQSFGGTGWSAGVPGDNATTGRWELNIPVGSWGTPGDNSTMVAPDHQHTPGGDFCYITQQSSSPTAALGERDVDGGTTTLKTPPLDLSFYDNPVITYYRWYINNPPSGANPGADWWQTFISGDGVTWIPIEETKVSDKSWRKFAFRVKDYIPLTSTMRMKFNVSDSIRVGQNLDGGSLIEAALDDMVIWESASFESIGERVRESLNMNLFPNPANDYLNVQYDLLQSDKANLEIYNAIGAKVQTEDFGMQRAGNKMHKVSVSGLSNGLYHVNLSVGDQRLVKNITINR